MTSAFLFAIIDLGETVDVFKAVFVSPRPRTPVDALVQPPVIWAASTPDAVLSASPRFIHGAGEQ